MRRRTAGRGFGGYSRACAALLQECSQQSLKILQLERPRLEALLRELLRVEILDERAIYRAGNLPYPADRDVRAELLDKAGARFNARGRAGDYT